MPASSVSSLNSVGDVVSGRNVRGRAFFPTFRPVQVYVSTVGTNVPTGGFTKVPFNTRSFDPQKGWNTTSFNITLGIPGMYLFAGAVNYANNANAGDMIISLFANGGESFRAVQTHNFNAATTLSFPFVFPVACATPVTVDIRMFNNSGLGITIVGAAASPLLSWLTINHIGGI